MQPTATRSRERCNAVKLWPAKTAATHRFGSVWNKTDRQQYHVAAKTLQIDWL